MSDKKDESADGPEPKRDGKREIKLPRGLDSGDIVLFNRRCLSMSPAGAALCFIAKFFSNSSWDHVGIVVKTPATGELMFLEADFGGVKLRSLEERLTRSKSTEIAIRKLSAVRTDAMREDLYAFSHEMLGRPYDISTGSMMARVKNQEEKQERAHYHSLLIEKRIQLNEIDRELSTGALTPFQKRFLQNERRRVLKSISFVQDHIGRLAKKSTSDDNGDEQLVYVDSAITEDGSLNGYGEYTKDLSRVFCSELVAAAYQRVGLLESYPPALSYDPVSFSSEQTNPPGIHLLRKARLGEEVFLRQAKTRKSSRKKGSTGEDAGFLRGASAKARFRGVEEGDNPSRDSRRLIRDVLKRTPLYKTIPDEYKRSHFVKSFHAHILEPGEVLFNQGDYGDSLFVIESGKVDRFVGKGSDDPILVSTLGPRNSFGLTGFSYTSKRGATIRARERTLLWQVDRPTYETFKDTSIDPESTLTGAELRMLRGILQDHFLFKHLDRLGPKELNAFFPVHFRAGEEIFKQGDAGDNFYIVMNGEVERHIRHPRVSDQNGDYVDDEESSLAKTLRPGQSFGELSLMYNAPRAATVRARTDVDCVAISAESFHKLNLGGGTQFLRTLFEVHASVKRDGKSYMTPDDFLYKFANIEAFPEEDQERLSSLLISLVTSNRERDPMKAAKQRSMAAKRKKDRDAQKLQHKDVEVEGVENAVLMDFWEFVRFDIVLNQPSPELDFAFRLADQNNSGFISLDELQYLLHTYADIDETARKMLDGESIALKKVFGKDGSNLISAKEFQKLSTDILPPAFLSDLKRLTNHMLNVEVGYEDADDPLADEIPFEQDGSPSMIGSQFVSKSVSSNGTPVSSPFSKDATENADVEPAPAKSVGIGVPLDHIICVGATAAASRTAVAPLERLKILMQTDSARKYRGIASGLRTMVSNDTGFIRAMYRGNGANLLRIIPAAVIQLSVVRSLRTSYAGYSNQVDENSVRFKVIESVLIGGIGGIVSQAAVYPLEFARGRLSVQNAGFEPYKGTFDALRKSVAKEGFGSIYRGMFPSLLGVFPYVGLSFGMYEALRPVLPKRNDGSSMPSSQSAILSGCVAVATCQFATFPLDTCRRRMQVTGFTLNAGTADQKVTFLNTAKEVYTNFGIKGFYRGIVPNLFKVLPSTAVSFFAFEYVRRAFDYFDMISKRTIGR